MEEEIGLEAYLTHGKGIKGKIKEKPEDFIVEEIPLYPKPANGRHFVVMVKSKNWETNKLVEKLASSMKISSKAIGYAGIKDKRAVTTQVMTFSTSYEKISNINIPGVEIDILYKTNKPIAHGMLEGNVFNIRIRHVENIESFYEILGEIKEYGGFPNFFGVQRFGIVRPITHIVGKYLLEGDFENAIMTYVATPIKEEDEKSYEARKYLMETHDFEGALAMFPKKLNFERRIIKYLINHPDDWENALLKLPSNLIRIFIHAYQSYLFNKILSTRIKEGIPINRAIEGDIILKDTWDAHGIYADKRIIERTNKKIKEGKCIPSGAIPGYDVRLARGKMGEIERYAMKKHSVNPEKFKMPYMPWLASAGRRRPLFVPLKKIRWKVEKNDVFLKFYLPRGCYATSLLREIMKADIYSY